MSARGDSVKETNINVSVRVRPRNPKEARESPVVVSCSKGREIVVKTGTSDLQSASKTYTFDRVFGPESDQVRVFKEVAVPAILEVMNGFSCTVFAYGQTGSGKTFTMEGDLADIRGPKAGIVPRSLAYIFDQLEKSQIEYGVKVSYVELYNEELRDLLSVDDNSTKLKLFDDGSRKGSVIIQGLEEVIVRNANDVLDIVKRASSQRQVAATLQNERSSRSHTVFSVTVQMKEEINGEELVKIGRLYLVDLAGSENIGRSGAVNKRAREAGAINQSLLTLGRVINSLVEKSAHIPYRESKLTRILQDSLGGRTQTYMIANVSPAKSSIEETLSTLDYAHRARNIRNKPEANQRLSKKVLIKEYAGEIERLKLDLIAAREKNGIFLSQQTYTELLDTNQSRKDRIEELLRDIESKEEEFSNLEVRYEEVTELYNDTKIKLSETENTLAVTKATLEKTEETLTQTQIELDDQKMLTSEHQKTEEHLDAVAKELAELLGCSFSELNSLHEKVDTKRTTDSQNMNMFSELQECVSQSLSQLRESVNEFGGSQAEFNELFKSRVSEFGDQLTSLCNEEMERLDTTANETKMQISALETDSHSFTDLVSDKLTGVMNGLQRHREQMSESLNRVQKAMLEELNSAVSALEAQKTRAKVVQENLVDSFVDLLTTVCEHLKTQSSTIADISSSIEEKLAQQSHALVARNASNMRRTTEISDEMVAQKNVLLDKIAGMVDDFTQRSLAAFHEHSDSTCRFNSDLVMQNSSNTAGIKENLGKVQTGNMMFEEKFRSSGTQFQDSVKAETQVSIESLDSINSQMLDVQRRTTTELEDVNTQVNAFTTQSHQSLETTVKGAQEFQQTQQDKSNTAHAVIDQSTRQTVESLGNFQSAWEVKAQCWTSDLDDSISTLKNTTSSLTSSLDGVDRTIGEARLHSEISTGKTPQKKEYKYPTSWPRTDRHETLIARFRQSSQQTLDEPMRDVTESSDSNEVVVKDGQENVPCTPSLQKYQSVSMIPTVKGVKRRIADDEISELETKKQHR